MISFGFATAGAIRFGAGTAAELPRLVAEFGKRALVCTGSRPDRHADLIASLGTTRQVLPVAGEPTAATVRAGLATAREFEPDVVISIGGGSVIDLGKAIAILLGNAGDPLDYLEIVGRGQPITQVGAPFVAVPTTAGTGSEVTANSVLAVPERQVKVSLRSPLMLPRLALIDPALTLGCPPAVTAASGLDALTQCLEPLVSILANPITDSFAARGLRHAASGLRRACADGTDLAARCDMALCGLFGGLALANAKLGAVHGLAGAVGGMANVPHGLACAALLAPVTEVNLRALRDRGSGSPALARYAEAAQALTGETGSTPDDLVAWIRRTTEELDVPGLATFGLMEEHLSSVVAAAANASSTKGNPIVLTAGELRSALAAAL
jgi:alcohol dehydrogenase class IV